MLFLFYVFIEYFKEKYGCKFWLYKIFLVYFCILKFILLFFVNDFVKAFKLVKLVRIVKSNIIFLF